MGDNLIWLYEMGVCDPLLVVMGERMEDPSKVVPSNEKFVNDSKTPTPSGRSQTNKLDKLSTSFATELVTLLFNSLII